MNLNRNANERYLAGDKIADEELVDLFAFYDDVSINLLQMGPVFHLAFAEANKHAIRLNDYATARGIRL